MAFENLSEKLGAAFKKLRSKGILKEADVREAMREVRLALLEADVNFTIVKEFVEKITEKAIGKDILDSISPSQQVIKIVGDELTSLMGGHSAKINLVNNPPTIVMMVGLQGAGKTTNTAKLAGMFKKSQSRRPLLVACDVYRPAAIEQLKIVGRKLELPVFEMGQGNPVEIAKLSIEHAKKHGNDIVFLDTAGRLHIDDNLMSELAEIKKVAKPHEIMLVVDAMIGQDAVTVAQKFDEILGIDGILMTKLDGDTRGGAALSVRHVTGKPIKYVGVGEKLEDIETFHPDRMASRILGKGDVLSLVEKAQETYDAKTAIELDKKIRSSKLTLSDFYDQLVQIKKMGSVEQLLGMIPGIDTKAMAGAKINEKALIHTESIILSMTQKERDDPSIINFSRKKRIASGCGLGIVEVNKLLKQFAQMQKMTKQMAGMKKRKGFKMPF